MMSYGKCQIRKKRLLITGILLVSIILGIFWFLSVRIEHVRSLIQSFSGPLELSAEETAELHTLSTRITSSTLSLKNLRKLASCN